MPAAKSAESVFLSFPQLGGLMRETRARRQNTRPPTSEIRRRRLALGWTQAELGLESGMAWTYVAQMERLPALLTPTAAARIAAALRCRVEDILPPASGS